MTDLQKIVIIKMITISFLDILRIVNLYEKSNLHVKHSVYYYDICEHATYD